MRKICRIDLFPHDILRHVQDSNIIVRIDGSFGLFISVNDDRFKNFIFQGSSKAESRNFDRG